MQLIPFENIVPVATCETCGGWTVADPNPDSLEVMCAGCQEASRDALEAMARAEGWTR